MDLSQLAPTLLDYILKPATSVAHDRAQVAPPRSLYHFTSMDGLIGMVVNRTIWASLTASLNDASEMLYAEEVARTAIQGGLPDVPEQITSDLGRLLRKEQTAVKVPATTLQVFVTSFSDSVDASSQWLHYGDRGKGIAMEFAATSLATPPFDLIPITYKETEQVALIRDVVRRVATSIQRLPGELGVQLGPGLYSFAAHMALQGIRLLAPGLKSPSFSSEQEWRMVTLELREQPGIGIPIRVKFRASAAGRLVPYVERCFAPKDLPLTGVVLGYACLNDPLDESFRLLVPNVSVRRSTVPVRP